MTNFNEKSREPARLAVGIILAIGLLIGLGLGYFVLQAPASPAEKEGARDFATTAKVTLDNNTMEPTLVAGTELEFLPRENHTFKRGEIVWLNDPQNGPTMRHIRRIIGLAGDTVEIKAGTVYLNGAALTENYIKAGPATNLAAVKVGEGQLFVLADNRTASQDSRQWGTITVLSVRGILTDSKVRK